MQKRSKEKIQCPFCDAEPMERSSQDRHHKKFHDKILFKEGRAVGQTGLNFGVSQSKTRKTPSTKSSDSVVTKKQRVVFEPSENLDGFTVDKRQALEFERYQTKPCACADKSDAIQATVKDLSKTNKLLTDQVSQLGTLVRDLTLAQTEQQSIKTACRDRKWVVLSADGSRAWCRVCSKWAHLTAKTGTQKSSPWINEGYDLNKIHANSKAPNRAFDWHEGANLSMHSVSMELEKSQQSLWDLNGVQNAMDTTKNMVRIVFQQAKMHMSDSSYEQMCYLLDCMGVNVGNWQHGRKAARNMKIVISEGMKELEQEFFCTPSPVTGLNPCAGLSADEVTRKRKTYNCQALQVMENGRPKALHLVAEELHEVKIDNVALTRSAIFAMARPFGVKPVENVRQIVADRITGMAFDGASAFQGQYNSVSAKLLQLNPDINQSHDRMHRLQLELKDQLRKFSRYDKCLDLCADAMNYFGKSTKKFRALDVLAAELQEINKYAELYKERIDNLADDEAIPVPEGKEDWGELSQNDLALAREFALQCGKTSLSFKKLYRVRMVDAPNKSLRALGLSNYGLFVKFLQSEVYEEQEPTKRAAARKLLATLKRFSTVVRFLSLIDITDKLRKHSRESQNDVLTVLELGFLNEEIHDDLADLADCAIVAGNRYRFGKVLREACRDLAKGTYQGVVLTHRPRSGDPFSAVRKLQRDFCTAMKESLQNRLKLSKFEAAAQTLNPANAMKASEEKIATDLEIVLAKTKRHISNPDSCRREFRSLKRLFVRHFADSEARDVLDIYEKIWTTPSLYKGLPNILRCVESVQTMSQASVCNERQGRTLLQTLTTERTNQAEDIVDAQLRIAINGCKLHDLNVDFFVKRWFQSGYRKATTNKEHQSSVLKRLHEQKSKFSIF